MCAGDDCSDLMAPSGAAVAKMGRASREEREAAFDVCNYLTAAIVAFAFGERPIGFDDKSIEVLRNFVDRKGKSAVTIISGDLALTFLRGDRPAIQWVDVVFGLEASIAA